MGLPQFLNTIEQTGLSKWLRETESPFGFYFVLLMHNLGLALVVGTSLFIGIRLLGFAPELPLVPVRKFFTVFWTGVWVGLLSGLFLLAAYPTKALTNPLFYLKLALVAGGVWIMCRVNHQCGPK